MDPLTEKKAENVAGLIGRFEKVIEADPEAPLAKYCQKRLEPLRAALRRHQE